MAQTIKHIRSSVAGKVPTSADLDLGVIGINTADGKAFLKRDNGTASIVEIGALADGAITNAKVASGAAIAHSKLASITAGSVLLGNATNEPTATALSGDVTINSSGIATVVSGTTSAAGKLQLTDSISSTSTSTAATPNAVKTAYDVANAALPKAGGTLTGNVVLPAGTAGAPALQPTGDTNTGVYFPAADTVAVSTGGVQRATVDSSGKLLVGTSTNISDAGIQSAAVTGDASSISTARFGASTNGGYFSIYRSRGATVGAHGTLLANDNVGALYFWASDGASYLRAAEITAAVDGTPGANDMPSRLVFSTTADGASSPTERMRITNAGYLSLNSAGTPTEQAYFYGYGSGTSLTAGSGVPYTGTYYINTRANNPGRGYNVSGRNIGLYAQAIGTGIVDHSCYGVVGYAADSIGNSGAIGVYGSTAVSVYNSGGPTAGVQGVRPGGGASTGYGYGVWAKAGSSLYGQNAGLYISVDTDGSGHAPTQGASIYDNNSGTRTAIAFTRTSGTVGSITTTTSATAYNTSSDYRLKENIVPLANACNRLKQIPVHRFNFIEEPGKTVDGFVAHEVQEFVPEAVTGIKDEEREEQYEIEPATPPVLDEDGNEIEPAKPPVLGTRTVPIYQGIDQSKLVPLLTAALQETIAELQTLKAEVAALKAS